MNLCSRPAEGPNDPRYVYGTYCTWHGPIREAAQRSTGVPCCPHCGATLAELPDAHSFWAMIRNAERDLPSYEAMLRWSRAQHFDTFDDLQSAYHQAMEGQS